MIYSVILENGSTGTINSNTICGQSACDFVGEVVQIQSHDKNGMPVEYDGILMDVLDEKNDRE
jgi:hypothetical protein